MTDYFSIGKELFFAHPWLFIGAVFVIIVGGWSLLSLYLDAKEGHAREGAFRAVIIFAVGVTAYLTLIFINKTQGWLW